MNTKNNKRRRESQTKIEKAFVNMFLEKSINKISVTDICKESGLNRTTFYANYIDVYDLAYKICKNTEDYFNKNFIDKNNRNAVNFFRIIYDNQVMFKVYFKLAYETNHLYDTCVAEGVREFFKEEHVKYHVEFFKSGLNAVIKMWLDGDCEETPEEMAEIIKSEYKGREFF